MSEGWQRLLAGLLVGIGLVGAAMGLRTRPAPEPLLLEMPTVEPSPTVAPTATPSPLTVYVTGEVAAPGVYVLPPGSRVVDAIRAAGGVTAGAAIEGINQATPLGDGMQIHMPARGTPVPPPALQGPPAAEEASAELGKVRINHAGAAELERLPGIGPALAARIIAHREANGPFETVDELTAVRGIGEKLLAGMREMVVVD